MESNPTPQTLTSAPSPAPETDDIDLDCVDGNVQIRKSELDDRPLESGTAASLSAANARQQAEKAKMTRFGFTSPDAPLPSDPAEKKAELLRRLRERKIRTGIPRSISSQSKPLEYATTVNKKSARRAKEMAESVAGSTSSSAASEAKETLPAAENKATATDTASPPSASLQQAIAAARTHLEQKGTASAKPNKRGGKGRK
jgi:hypothetical protein